MTSAAPANLSLVAPDSLSTESIVLGVLLYETDTIRPHLDRLTFEMFYRPVHRVIARLALEDVAEHGIADYLTIGTRAVEAAGLAQSDVTKLLEDLTSFAAFCDPIRIERAVTRLDEIHRDTCLKGVLAEVNVAVGEGRITADEAVEHVRVAEAGHRSPGSQAALTWQPFPVHVLPPILGTFVHESALALGLEAAFVAMPALAACAAMIGTTRRIQLRGTWRELPILWCAVVARSGTVKSPAHDRALAPVRGLEKRAFAVHAEAMTEYEQARLRYERDLANWKKSKSGDPPEKPDPPACVRYTVNDTTIEALAAILLDNPRGVLLARDELSGWFGSHGQYKGGRGDDEAKWLELHRGGLLIVDRKSGNPRTIHVPRAAASICGTIQPSILRRALTHERFASGMAARFLLAAPPERKKCWVTPEPSPAAEQSYARMLIALSALRHGKDPHGDVGPVDIPLDSDAWTLFGDFYQRHAERQLLARSDAEAAALAKLEAYAARLALIFHLSRMVVGQAAERSIDAESVAGGIELAEWFIHETRRIYATLGGAAVAPADPTSRLVSLVYAKGGQITPRELQRADRRFRDDSEGAEKALADLARRGYGQIVTASSGGRPATRFHLAPTTSTNDESTAAPEGNGTFVDRPASGEAGEWRAVP